MHLLQRPTASSPLLRAINRVHAGIRQRRTRQRWLFWLRNCNRSGDSLEMRGTCIRSSVSLLPCLVSLGPPVPSSMPPTFCDIHMTKDKTPPTPSSVTANCCSDASNLHSTAQGLTPRTLSPRITASSKVASSSSLLPSAFPSSQSGTKATKTMTPKCTYFDGQHK
jgi:hypothetical protein